MRKTNKQTISGFHKLLKSAFFSFFLLNLDFHCHTVMIDNIGELNIFFFFFYFLTFAVCWIILVVLLICHHFFQKHPFCPRVQCGCTSTCPPKYFKLKHQQAKTETLHRRLHKSCKALEFHNFNDAPSTGSKHQGMHSNSNSTSSCSLFLRNWLDKMK